MATRLQQMNAGQQLKVTVHLAKQNVRAFPRRARQLKTRRVTATRQSQMTALDHHFGAWKGVGETGMVGVQVADDDVVDIIGRQSQPSELAGNYLLRARL